MKRTTKALSFLLLAVLCFGVLTACANPNAEGAYVITSLAIDGVEQSVNDCAGLSLTLDKNGDYHLFINAEETEESQTLGMGDWTMSNNAINFTASEESANFIFSLLTALLPSVDASLDIIGGADGPTSVLIINETLLQSTVSSCTYKENALTVEISGLDDKTIVLIFSKAA